jgi:hypothetical protein
VGGALDRRRAKEKLVFYCPECAEREFGAGSLRGARQHPE